MKKVNHRFSDRFAADLKLIICRNNLLVDVGTITNMGNFGLFIESDFCATYVGQMVEIEFCLDDIKELSNCRFRGKVAHKSTQGFGVQVEETYAKIPQALRNLGRVSRRVPSNRQGFQRKKLFLHVTR
jgi:hypothetical protein